MRFFTLFILLLVFSCNPGIHKDNLTGTWTTVEDPQHPKNGITDKLTFYSNDSFLVETYWNGNLQEQFTGRYTFDEKKKILITRHDTVEFRSEVLELTNNSLVTRQEGTNTIAKYKRM